MFVDEQASSTMRAMVSDDPTMTAWWATQVECGSAIARRERSGDLEAAQATASITALERLARTWLEVPPTSALRDIAGRLVRRHDLRAADAFQLAAATIAGAGAPDTLPFVTLDARLALAATREGFPVLSG